jgi:hypothetical protein
MPRIENAHWIDGGRVVGRVFGHPDFADGEVITTSPANVAGYDFVQVRTWSGTEYFVSFAEDEEARAARVTLVEGE